MDHVAESRSACKNIWQLQNHNPSVGFWAVWKKWASHALWETYRVLRNSTVSNLNIRVKLEVQKELSLDLEPSPSTLNSKEKPEFSAQSEPSPEILKRDNEDLNEQVEDVVPPSQPLREVHIILDRIPTWRHFTILLASEPNQPEDQRITITHFIKLFFKGILNEP